MTNRRNVFKIIRIACFTDGYKDLRNAKMKKIGIIAKPQNSHAVKKILDDLLPWLARQGKEVFLDTDTGSIAGLASPHQKSKIPSLVEMVIVLGGDGTLLSVARLVEGTDVPILGVNLGGLGFLTEVTVEELFSTLSKIFKNEFVTDDRLMLKAVVHRQGERVAQSLVLNDVVISKGTLARMIKLEIFINNQFVTALRGDGLILAKAGVDRLGRQDRITEVLPAERVLPAVGQGPAGPGHTRGLSPRYTRYVGLPPRTGGRARRRGRTRPLRP